MGNGSACTERKATWRSSREERLVSTRERRDRLDERPGCDGLGQEGIEAGSERALAILLTNASSYGHRRQRAERGAAQRSQERAAIVAGQAEIADQRVETRTECERLA